MARGRGLASWGQLFGPWQVEAGATGIVIPPPPTPGPGPVSLRDREGGWKRLTAEEIARLRGSHAREPGESEARSAEAERNVRGVRDGERRLEEDDQTAPDPVEETAPALATPARADDALTAAALADEMHALALTDLVRRQVLETAAAAQARADEEALVLLLVLLEEL
jgi:hypothetical protein